MSAFKRLAPDPAENIHAAMVAAEQLAGMHNQIMTLVDTIQTHLTICDRAGMKAAKLDYCVRRIVEIRHQLNVIEIGSFAGIAVKNTCEELWRKLP